MWELEQSEFTNVARRKQHEIWLDKESPGQSNDHYLEIMLEIGAGYSRESINTGIPLRQLIKMMEHVGYKVTKP